MEVQISVFHNITVLIEDNEISNCFFKSVSKIPYHVFSPRLS